MFTRPHHWYLYSWSQMNPVNPHIRFSTFNIIVPSTTRSSKWSSFRIYVRSCVRLYLIFLLRQSFRNSGQRTAGGDGIKAGTLRIHSYSFTASLGSFNRRFFLLFLFWWKIRCEFICRVYLLRNGLFLIACGFLNKKTKRGTIDTCESTKILGRM
jgi:hypothetical protein